MRMLFQSKTPIGILIFALFTLAYFLSAKGNTEITDTYFSIQTAKAVITNNSLSAQGCRPGHCFKSQKDGKYYSRSGLGLAFLFIPYVLAGKIIALSTGLPETRLIDFFVSFYNIFFGAGACVITFYIAKFFKNSDRASLSLALLLGFATFCWRYSIWDFSETTQMFFLLLSIYLVFKNTPGSLILGGSTFCCLFLLKILYLACLPIFILYIFARNKTGIKNALTRIAAFLFMVLLGFCFILIFNHLRFGKIFEFGYGLEANKFYLSGILQHTGKLLFWLDKGMFIYNPLFILGILGYYKLFKSFPKEAVFLLSMITFNLLLTSTWYGWHGNWSWGPRYLVPTAGLWLIPIFVFFHKKGIIRVLLIFLVCVSVLIQLLSVLQGNLEYLAICNTNNQEGLRKGMPAQIVGSLIILKHKIIKKDNLYLLSEFGVNSNSKVDTTEFGYKKGLDFWYLKN